MLGMLVTPAILIVATVGGHQAWEWQAERRLDHLIDGLRHNGQPVSMAELTSATTAPESQNGAVDLRKASDGITLDESWQGLFGPVPVQLPLTDDELTVLRQAVKSNRETLASIRAAMDKPLMDWNALQPPAPRMPFPFGGRATGYFRQRSISQLLYVGTLVAHHDHDDRTALDRIDDILFIARATAKRPSIRAQILSLRLYDVACTSLIQILPELAIGDEPGQAPKARVKSLCRQLLDEQDTRESMLYCLRVERARQLDAARGILVPNLRDTLGGGSGGGGGGLDSNTWNDPLPMPSPGAPVERTLYRPVYLGRVQQSLERLEIAMQSLEAPAYRGFLSQFPEGSTEPNDSEGADDKSLRLLTTAIQQIGRSYYATLARCRASGVALAVVLYRAEHEGHWPSSDLKKALVPEYLSAVPADPLATSGESIVFVPSEKRPRVYSVGDDGIDDGGFPPDPFAASMEELRMTDFVIDLSRQPRPQSRN